MKPGLPSQHGIEPGPGSLGPLTALAREAARKLGRPVSIMEVCGTHTAAIARSGIKSILAGSVDMRSGPGCPVCVTDQIDIDRIIALSQVPGVVIATFGDMVRVPGSSSSLEKERARGAAVEMFYSPMDALSYAEDHRDREVIFAGVGFETTTPVIAATAMEAKNRGLSNFSIYPAHKIVPPAMRTLLDDPLLGVDGFLLPGHVSTILGRKAFDFIATDYGLPSVIAGFETADIIGCLSLLLHMIVRGEAKTLNGYPRLVKEEGNPRARTVADGCLEVADARWRGFGLIPQSGLVFRREYGDLDALKRFPVDVPEPAPYSGCGCGDVLKGKMKPGECPLFGTACTPFEPVGPCMVSSEGACAAWYQYDYAQ